MKPYQLNKKQEEAACHKEGPMIVLAGPGSGKTTVIVHRINHLIEQHNVLPQNIAVITFTKSAAEEMRIRIRERSGTYIEKQVTVGTFHSLFFRLTRPHLGYRVEDILTDNERRDSLKKIMHELEIDVPDQEDFVSKMLGEISLVKNELIDAQFHNPLQCGTDDFKAIYDQYEQSKRSLNKIDFDDMLVDCHTLLKSKQIKNHHYQYFMIDEFQDINKVQYECIKMLTLPHNNLFIVGDDDQSIYKFRGSRPEFLLRFPKEFANTKQVVLDINYRSTDQIIQFCNDVIAENKNRYPKNICGTSQVGKPPIFMTPADIGEEAIQIAGIISASHKKVDYADVAVIYRTNIQSRALVDAFMDLNIPFHVRDESPSIYDHWVAKDILAYFRLALDGTNKASFERIINKPKRYLNKYYVAEAVKINGDMLDHLFLQKGLQKWQLLKIEELAHHLNIIKRKNTFDAIAFIRRTIGYDTYIKEYAAFRKVNAKGLFEVLDEISESAKQYKTLEEFLVHTENVLYEISKRKRSKAHKNEGVTLTTMHSAKGLEFDVVFVTSAIEGVIPYEKTRSEPEIEEERRLFYVALTRAKKTVYISLVQTRYSEPATATRFLDHMVLPSN